MSIESSEFYSCQISLIDNNFSENTASGVALLNQSKYDKSIEYIDAYHAATNVMK
jgi:hypothetical protein